MGQLQDDFDRNFPSSDVDFLAINEEGQESANDVAAALNDLPLLQDVDANNDAVSDVWESWWAHDGNYVAGVAWRDVHIVNPDGELTDVLNLTRNDLRDQDNYDSLRALIVEAATANRQAASPWQNRVEPMDVNNDGFVAPNDVLRVINRINAEGAGELPSPDASVASYYDVTGDNILSPLDVLRVVRQINIHSLSAAGEPDEVAEPSSTVSSASVDAYFAFSIADQDDENSDD